MDASVTEFHSIMPIANVASVMERGILCHEFAARLRRKPSALPSLPDQNHQGHVPGGLKLNQYARLYFDARNPLLFKLKGVAEQLCVLRVSVNALGIRGVVLADRDAASDYVRFLAPEQWSLLRLDDIYGRDGEYGDNLVQRWRHEALKCAELLSPECVEPEFVVGAYVASETARERLNQTGFPKWITVNPWLFFRVEASGDDA